MNHILIYGVPDVGKTTITKCMHAKTGIYLIEGDFIRIPYPATKYAWRKFGSLTKENAIRGLLYVRDYMHKDVDKVLDKHKEVILEAVFIDPVKYHNRAKMYLLVCTDEATHRKQFFKKRAETDESRENFLAIRMIQEFLLNEAKKLKVKVIQNDSNPDVVAQQIISEISTRAL